MKKYVNDLTIQEAKFKWGNNVNRNKETFKKSKSFCKLKLALIGSFCGNRSHKLFWASGTSGLIIKTPPVAVLGQRTCWGLRKTAWVIRTFTLPSRSDHDLCVMFTFVSSLCLISTYVSPVSLSLDTSLFSHWHRKMNDNNLWCHQ